MKAEQSDKYLSEQRCNRWTMFTSLHYFTWVNHSTEYEKDKNFSEPVGYLETNRNFTSLKYTRIKFFENIFCEIGVWYLSIRELHLQQ